MDAFIKGKSYKLWGLDDLGHDGEMGQVCNIMGCSLIVNKFIGVDVFDATHIATGKTDHQFALISDYKIIWTDPRSNEGHISLGIPEKCPFGWTAEIIAKKSDHRIEFIGFTETQLASYLNAQQYGPDTPLKMLQGLGQLVKDKIMPVYSVEDKGDVFVMRVEVD